MRTSRFALPLACLVLIAGCCLPPDERMHARAPVDEAPIVAPTARAQVYDTRLNYLRDDRHGAAVIAGGAGHVLRQRVPVDAGSDTLSNCRDDEVDALRFDCAEDAGGPRL